MRLALRASIAALTLAAFAGPVGANPCDEKAGAERARGPTAGVSLPPPATSPVPVPTMQNEPPTSKQTDATQPSDEIAGDAIEVEGEGPIAQCCPFGMGEEECRGYLASDVKAGQEFECAVDVQLRRDESQPSN